MQITVSLQISCGFQGNLNALVNRPIMARQVCLCKIDFRILKPCIVVDYAHRQSMGG